MLSLPIVLSLLTADETLCLRTSDNSGILSILIPIAFLQLMVAGKSKSIIIQTVSKTIARVIECDWLEINK